MEWHDAIEKVSPYVVRITTPENSGTGWLVSRAETTDLCGIATAAHTIQHAYEWDAPIRISHPASGGSVLLKSDARSLLLEPALDTAAIVFSVGDLSFPDQPLSLVGLDEHYKRGVEIGWLGFPAMAAMDVCFFSGRVSACLEGQRAFLVDGVAINGVSGGPAFTFVGDLLEVVGIVAAYVPNRETGEALPGVAVIRDVTQFQFDELTERFRSFRDAKSQEPSLDMASEQKRAGS